MKLLKKEYVPEEIDFQLPENSILPDIIGKVKSLDECHEMISKTFVATNQKITATRYMDAYEKEMTREEYQQELEIVQPELDKRLSEAKAKLDQAKKEFKDLEDQATASDVKVKDLARQVRIGTKDINLDQASTWRVPLNGQYFYLTYMRGNLMIADIVDIPDHEKQDLFNSQSRNEEAVGKLIQLIEEAV